MTDELSSLRGGRRTGKKQNLCRIKNGYLRWVAHRGREKPKRRSVGGGKKSKSQLKTIQGYKRLNGSKRCVT